MHIVPAANSLPPNVAPAPAGADLLVRTPTGAVTPPDPRPGRFLRHDRMVSLPSVDASAMVGLNCGTPSAAAWSDLRAGVDAVVAIGDDRAREAVTLLAEAGVRVGMTGAAAGAGLLEVLRRPDAHTLRTALSLGDDARVLLLGTEGP